MTPDEFVDSLQHESDELTRLRLLASYFADPYQWKDRLDGSVRWGWFTRSPAELAALALEKPDEPSGGATAPP